MNLLELLTASILLPTVSLATCGGEDVIQASQATARKQLDLLPESLPKLLVATGYLEWDGLRVYSQSLKHYRQLRFSPGSNVFISETGAKEGQVDIVEVILIQVHPESKVEFALYDPKSGNRVERYPDSILFDVFGIAGGSGNPAPGICISCHEERAPLNALIPWSQALQNDLERARGTGQGIRQDLVRPIPDDAATEARIARFNAIMQDRFPEHINDFRKWMERPVAPQ